MGTETPLRSVVLKILSFSYVKLNNPLMGTEMLKRGEKYERDLHTGVKLNNPLVGTEIKGGESIMGGTFGRPR